MRLAPRNTDLSSRHRSRCGVEAARFECWMRSPLLGEAGAVGDLPIEAREMNTAKLGSVGVLKTTEYLACSGRIHGRSIVSQCILAIRMGEIDT